MDRFANICLFGGTHLGKDAEFQNAARDLGKTLAARKINLVYGGGVQGLQGSVAHTAITKGCKVLSITSRDDGTSKFSLGTEIKAVTMSDRLIYMLYNADAFIVLPGGLGALEEISTIIIWANKNIHRKPLGFLNINGFYDGFLSFLDNAVEQEFMPQAMRRTIVSASTADELLDQLQHLLAEPIQIEKQGNPSNDDSRKKGNLDTTLRL
mgnify:CR=1 FL=1